MIQNLYPNARKWLISTYDYCILGRRSVTFDLRERNYNMIKKILVATDGSTHARKAIAHASDLAARYHAMIYLIHVVPKREIPGEVRHYIEIEGIKEPPDQVYYQRIGEGIIEAGVRELKEEGVNSVESFVLDGDPAEIINGFAKDRGVDIIVMGSRGLGGIKQMFLGSISRAVCDAAHCTCVTVR